MSYTTKIRIVSGRTEVDFELETYSNRDLADLLGDIEQLVKATSEAEKQREGLDSE